MARRNRTLSVMSFNVRYGTAEDGVHAWPFRRPHALAMLRWTRPDVLCVQEALRFQLDAIERAFLRYESVGVGREDGIAGGEHSQVFFDGERFALLSQETFWLSDTPSAPGSSTWGNANVRICTVARLRDRAAGRDLAVYNTHLDHESERARVLGASLIAERASVDAGGPLLIVGDFNEGEDGPVVQSLRERLPGLIHAFRALHPRTRRVNTYHGYTGEQVGVMIDHVLALGLTPTAARIVRGSRAVSDHFPLLCSFEWPSTPSAENRAQSD